MRMLPLTPFFLLIFAITIFTISVTQYGGIGQHGAGYMPTIISGLLLFFSVVNIVIDVKKDQEGHFPFNNAECKALLLISVSVMLFVFLLSVLGFIICACLLLFGLMKIRGVKCLMAAVVAIIFSLVIYFIFARILLVAFPDGILL